MTTFAILCAAITILTASNTAANMVRGVSPETWQFRMNESPKECKENHPVPSDCTPQGMWHRRPGGYQENVEYYVEAEGKHTYSEAMAICSNMNAEVASIHSQEELEFLVSLQYNNRHGFWLGVQRDDALFETGMKSAPGFFTYDDGTPVDFTSFAPGEPNSNRYGTDKNGKEGHFGALVDQWIDRCIIVGLNQRNPSLWNDASCEKNRRVVCKRSTVEPFASDTCNGVSDADVHPDCDNYYISKCDQSVLNPFIAPTTFDETWASVCKVKCNTCMTTTTTLETTTSTEAKTTVTTDAKTTVTTDAPTTTTTVATTTTTNGPTSTTTFETSTTTFETTTTTMQTTTSTIAPYTTTTTTITTTTVATTSTSEEPTTVDIGICSKRGWTDPAFDPNTGTHCCYKYESKPKLKWSNAEAQCNAFADQYSHLNQVNGHLASLYNDQLNYDVKRLRDAKPGQSSSETAWIGGLIPGDRGDSNVSWVNPFFSMYNQDFGANGINAPFNNFPVAMEGGRCHSPSCSRQSNGMFYEGEPSGFSGLKGKVGSEEDCLVLGAGKRLIEKMGDYYWNDGKCAAKKSYFCEFCWKESTTTTFETTSTTQGPTTTTTAGPTTTTTWASSTTTLAPTTTTTTVTTTTTEAPTTVTVGETTTTTTAPVSTTTTKEPTTTTTAEPDCSIHECGAECGNVYDKRFPYTNANPFSSYCGWSKKHNACIAGGRTTTKELGEGRCTVSTLPTTTTPKPEPVDQYCAQIYCANDCGYGADTRMNYDEEGNADGYACGWSSKHDRCLAGANTKMPKELNLGPKC